MEALPLPVDLMERGNTTSKWPMPKCPVLSLHYTMTAGHHKREPVVGVQGESPCFSLPQSFSHF